MLMANIDPETANSAALELLLSAKFQLNEIDQVLEILEPELQTRGNNPILLGLYGLARLARQDLAGIADIEKSLEMQPKNNRLRLALLTFYQRQGLLPQALDQARTAYSIDPLDPAAREALVQLLLRSDKIEETLALAEEIASSSPGESHAQQLAGVAYLMAGNPAQAAEHLQRAIEIAPDNAVRGWHWRSSHTTSASTAGPKIILTMYSISFRAQLALSRVASAVLKRKGMSAVGCKSCNSSATTTLQVAWRSR